MTQRIFTTGPVQTRDERGRHYTVTDLAPSRPTSDRVLEAVPPGKVCALGRIWAGDLKPLLDSQVEAVRPLVSGFTLNQTLTPEPTVSRGQELSTGRTWGNTRDYVARVADAMRSQVYERAERDDRAPSEDALDLSGVMDALKELKEQAQGGHPQAVHAALDAVREAIGNVKATSRCAASDDGVKLADAGGTPLPAGGVTRVIREFRERTTDGRPRGAMQRANEEFRRKRAEERCQVEALHPWDGPEAA